MANIFRHPHFQKPKFDPMSPSASEIIYPDTDCPDDDHERESKRRRIESLGERYLKGHPLVIHSAVLKGTLRGTWTTKSGRTQLREGDRIRKPSADQTGNNRKPKTEKAVLKGPRHAPIVKTWRREKSDTERARPSTSHDEHTRDSQVEQRNPGPVSSAACDGAMSGREPACVHHWLRQQRESPTEPSPVGYSTDPERTPSWLRTQNLRSPLPEIARDEHSGDEHVTPSKSYQRRDHWNQSEDESFRKSKLDQGSHTAISDAHSLLAEPQSLQITPNQGYSQQEEIHARENLAGQRTLDISSRKACTAASSASVQPSSPARRRNPSRDEAVSVAPVPAPVKSSSTQNLSHCSPSQRFLITRKTTEAKSSQNSGKTVANGAHAANSPTSVDVRRTSAQKHVGGFTPINIGQHFSPASQGPQNTGFSSKDQTAPSIVSVSRKAALKRNPSAATKTHQRPVSAAERTHDRPLVESSSSMNKVGVAPQSHAQSPNERRVSTTDEPSKPKTGSHPEKAKHPFNASPNGPSPGFPFRKVRDSAPGVKMAELPTNNQLLEFSVLHKQPHFMTFETPNSHDVKAATVDDNARLAISPAALPTDLPGKSAEHDLNKKDIKESRHSLLSDGSSPEAQPPHNLSTQAAVVLAQEAFQGQLVSAEQDAEEEYRPEQSTNSLLRQNTPPTQQSVSEMSPITPFKTFNLKSASAGVRHTDAGEISTQDLFNAATPFAFSTVKKQNNAGVYMSSPSKHAAATASKDSSKGDTGEETMASVTLAADSIPIHQSVVSVSSQRLQSGLKKHSRDPAISPGIALLKGGSAEAQDQLSGTVRSNSTLSAPHESGRQLRSEDSSELQEGQIHDFVDDVDVDVDVNAAIDDAGSFLQSWRLESELPSREKIRSSLVAPVGSQ